MYLQGLSEGIFKKTPHKFIIESWKQTRAPTKANFLLSVTNCNFFDCRPLQPQACLNNSPFNLCD